MKTSIIQTSPPFIISFPPNLKYNFVHSRNNFKTIQEYFLYKSGMPKEVITNSLQKAPTNEEFKHVGILLNAAESDMFKTTLSELAIPSVYAVNTIQAFKSEDKSIPEIVYEMRYILKLKNLGDDLWEIETFIDAQFISRIQ